jgi:hypothetical protein
MASAQFTDRVFTSVAGRTIHGHTLILAGSKAGDVIQVCLFFIQKIQVGFPSYFLNSQKQLIN